MSIGRPALVALVALAALAACRSPSATPAGGGEAEASIAIADASVLGLDAGASPGDASAESPGLTFREAVRLARWEEAEAAARRLPDAERGAPDVRLARARAALERAEYKQVVELLTSLEQELPLLDARVKKLRRAAMAQVGPFDVAAEAFLREGTARGYLAAAQAYERAGDPARARSAAERAIAQTKRPHGVEEAARRLRLALAHDPNSPRSTDPDDARWLAIHASSPKEAEQALAKLGGSLSGADWLRRAHELAESQQTDAALRSLERAATAEGRPDDDALCHARAEALYKSRSRYSEAAVAYGACERRGGARAAEDAFLAARALSRADRDREAELAMKRVRERYPRSPFAAQARFHLGRIAYLHGDYPAAVAAFDELASAKGHARGETPRYRALAHFAAHDYRTARRLFEALADEADDAQLRARCINLAALAALRDGDRTHAVARWSEVVRTHPLSFAALVAQARLAEAKAPPVAWVEAPSPASGPVAVALPPPVDLLHGVGLDEEAEDELRAREAFVESAYPGRGVEALCGAYALTGRAKRLHQIALRVPSALLGESPEGRARWAWDCAFPRPFPREVKDAEALNGLVGGLVHAVMRQESGFDPEVVSPARAVGLLQLLPETAKAVSERAKLPYDERWLTRPGPNIALGARYLHELGEKLDDDPLRVAGAYNAGPEAMARWQSRSQGLDLETFVESIPYLETRGYVVRVMGNLARYGFASGGDAGVPKLKLQL